LKGVSSIDRGEQFEAMYRQCEQRVLGYALRRAPVEVAKDAVAETFLAAWRRFDELPQDPLPWLIGTTRRTLANQRRSSVRQARLANRLADETPGRMDGALAGDDDSPVRAAFQRLTVDDREALALIAWEGLTPSQAARSLGCSAVAFRVRLHRARRRFDRALRQEGAQASAVWREQVANVEEAL
jgi:RNA polymerase sigma-70 factor (ECF subfamily)